MFYILLSPYKNGVKVNKKNLPIIIIYMEINGLKYHYFYLEGKKFKIYKRSDNSVKNHFYSTLRKAFRGLNKYIS